MGIFIDLTKNFDTLDHNTLIIKLNYYGVRDVANKSCFNNLESGKQFVTIVTIVNLRPE